MRSSKARSSIILLQTGILLLIATLPGTAQDRPAPDSYTNVSPATSSAAILPNAISETQAATPVYPPQSDQFKAARKILAAGNYDEYVQQLEKSGVEGDNQCLNELGTLYLEGRIVKQDYKKAFDIFQALSEKGYGTSMCYLGAMYLTGVGCTKDSTKALELFVQASNLDCDYGLAARAYMYRDGEGCPKDAGKALELFEQLSRKSSPLGWFGKARLLWSGTGLKEDRLQALALCKRAAEAGLAGAQERLADLYFTGTKEIPADQKLALYWAERGSAQGAVGCQLQLARIKMNGAVGVKDCSGGIALLRRLAEQSIAEAQNALGHAYHTGQCVTKNCNEALLWLEKAAERDNYDAIVELADMYTTGDGIAENLTRAFELNLKAATLDKITKDQRARSQFSVAFAYEYGSGVKEDWNQARIWYAKAASAGNPHACNNLALLYKTGRGCAINQELALSLFRQGAKEGCWMACTNLGRYYLYGQQGVAKNVAIAISLFKKSLQLNSENSFANYELAAIFEKGLTGKVDLKLADKYYQEAIKHGSRQAIEHFSDEKVLTFNTPVTLPKHRSKYIIYDLDPRKEKFFVHVPKKIDPKQKYGLIVYIDTSDTGTSVPWQWMKVLHDRKLLFVSPQNAGNTCGTYQRSGLAVLGALEMMQKYSIDKNRVYVAGLLGGARLASILGFNQYDLFRGTIQSCGSDFYRNVKVRYPIAKEEDGEPYGLCEASAAEVAAARKQVKFALITGKDDFRRSNVLNIYHEGFAKEGFKAKLFEVEKIGRNDCSGKTLEEALNFLQ
jgi:TPR repeat protein